MQAYPPINPQRKAWSKQLSLSSAPSSSEIAAIQVSRQVPHGSCFTKGQLSQQQQQKKPRLSKQNWTTVTAELSRAHNSKGDMTFQTQNYYKRAPERAENLAGCTKGPTQPQEPLRPWNHSLSWNFMVRVQILKVTGMRQLLVCGRMCNLDPIKPIELRRVMKRQIKYFNFPLLEHLASQITASEKLSQGNTSNSVPYSHIPSAHRLFGLFPFIKPCFISFPDTRT